MSNRPDKQEVQEALNCLAREGILCPTYGLNGCECGEVLAREIPYLWKEIEHHKFWKEHFKKAMLKQRVRAEKAEGNNV